MTNQKEEEDSGANTVQGQVELLKACDEAAALICPPQTHPRIPLGARRHSAASYIRQTVVSFTQPVIDFAEWGWTIIANASGGDWKKESADWQEAAARYRDEFYTKIRHYAPSTPIEVHWIPTSERLPEVCKPVIGYADRWVDSEYNEMGMRECFRNDDYWQSAAWNNYQDCWDVEQGEPDYWMPYPSTPSVEPAVKQSTNTSKTHEHHNER